MASNPPEPIQLDQPDAVVQAPVPSQASNPPEPIQLDQPDAVVQAPVPSRLLRPRNPALQYFPSSVRKTFGAPAPRKELPVVDRKQKRHRRAPVEMSLTMDPTAEVNLLRVQKVGPRIGPRNWCCSCRNGGLMNICDNNACMNAFCTRCIEVNSDIEFKCPKCHLLAKWPGPYPHTLLNAPATRETLPEIKTDPVAIISLHISGINAFETPAVLVYDQLFIYLQGNIVFIDIDFDLLAYRANFEDRMNDLVDLFVTGELKEWKRFLIFVTTHSEPTEGLLHMGPNGCGAVPVLDLFSVIFPPQLRKLLKQSKSNLLGLLACGAVSTAPQSKIDLQQFANLGLFEKILTFTQPEFQPALTFNFFEDVALNHFIFGRQNLRYILVGHHEGIGSHSGLISFQVSMNTSYVWTHRGAHPMGKPLPPQCPICKHLRSWKFQYKESDDTVTVLRCLKCPNGGGEFRAERPDNSEWLIRGETQDSPYGAWYVVVDREIPTSSTQ